MKAHTGAIRCMEINFDLSMNVGKKYNRMIRMSYIGNWSTKLSKSIEKFFFLLSSIQLKTPLSLFVILFNKDSSHVDKVPP